MHTDHEKRRFWTRVRQGPDGCWLWSGALRDNGYGLFAVKRSDGAWTYTTAQRWAYEDLVASVPSSQEVDHLCRVRACVRPDHLEAVTVAENRRRRDIKYAPAVDRSLRPLPTLPAAPYPLKKPRKLPRPGEVKLKVVKTHCRNGHEYAVVGKIKNGKNMTCAACMRARYPLKGKPAPKTHCPQGHEYTEGNSYWHVKPNGAKYRECRTCVLDHQKAVRSTVPRRKSMSE